MSKQNPFTELLYTGLFSHGGVQLQNLATSPGASGSNKVTSQLLSDISTFHFIKNLNYVHNIFS